MTNDIGKPTDIIASGITNLLTNPQIIKHITDDLKDWRQSWPGDIRGTLGLGVLSPAVVEALNPASAIITMSKQRMGHLLRASKRARGAGLTDADFDNIPANLASPKAILRDTQGKGDALIYVFDSVDSNRAGKVVVEVDFKDRVNPTGKKRVTVKSNPITTAGYVSAADLKIDRYVLLEGEI